MRYIRMAGSNPSIVVFVLFLSLFLVQVTSFLPFNTRFKSGRRFALHCSSQLQKSKLQEEEKKLDESERRRITKYNLNANEYWQWKGQRIRFVSQGVDQNIYGPTVVLVHGLFVNADHFRKQMNDLANNGFRVYAIDLLGNGYSSKPYPTSEDAQKISGEQNRPDMVSGINLGTANGNIRKNVDIKLTHPVQGSVYNFFTWAEQLIDFVDQVAKPNDGKTILVCNSIGTISSLQAAIDRSDIFDACYIINPNFRELHVAESPKFIQPIVTSIQSWLRVNGQGIFESLAKPNTVKNILMEPYYNKDAVTNELVDVLLSPLLRDGSGDVVFDTLSYSAGPLPEQQLQSTALVDTMIEVCYGVKDPWTPPMRVEGLKNYIPVKKVTPLQNVGHCPHDEAPELVNPLIIDFVNRVVDRRRKDSENHNNNNNNNNDENNYDIMGIEGTTTTKTKANGWTPMRMIQ